MEINNGKFSNNNHKRQITVQNGLNQQISGVLSLLSINKLENIFQRNQVNIPGNIYPNQFYSNFTQNFSQQSVKSQIKFLFAYDLFLISQPVGIKNSQKSSQEKIYNYFQISIQMSGLSLIYQPFYSMKVLKFCTSNNIERNITDDFLSNSAQLKYNESFWESFFKFYNIDKLFYMKGITIQFQRNFILSYSNIQLQQQLEDNQSVLFAQNIMQILTQPLLVKNTKILNKINSDISNIKINDKKPQLKGLIVDQINQSKCGIIPALLSQNIQILNQQLLQNLFKNQQSHNDQSNQKNRKKVAQKFILE